MIFLLIIGPDRNHHSCFEEWRGFIRRIGELRLPDYLIRIHARNDVGWPWGASQRSIKVVDEGLDIGHVDNAPSNLRARGHGGYGGVPAVGSQLEKQDTMLKGSTLSEIKFSTGPIPLAGSTSEPFHLSPEAPDLLSPACSSGSSRTSLRIPAVRGVAKDVPERMVPVDVVVIGEELGPIGGDVRV